jgi:hypothetical protein
VTKRDDTYSVRLPSGFPYVGSKIARQMLTALFARRVPLANDPGPGEKYLKLTLPRTQVRALRTLADGDAPGVALRRLVATFARGLPARESRPVRQLPMARTYPVLEAEIIEEPEVRKSRPLPQPLVPEAEALRSSLKNRLDWTPEYRAMIVERIRELEGVVDLDPSRPKPTSRRSIARRSSGALMADPVFRTLFLLVAVLVVLAIHFGGWPALASDGPEARPAMPYPQWRPK